MIDLAYEPLPSFSAAPPRKLDLFQMQIRIIKSSFDTGQYEIRMGRGPGRILDGGAVARLQALGHEVRVVNVDPKPAFPAEVSTAFAVMAGVAEEVRRAMAGGDFPIVLAGNCNTTVGAVSGLAPRQAGVVWFDGHADFETPETTTSGFVDGMGLAVLTGRCWQSLAASVPGFAPLPEKNVILAGASDFGPSERESLRNSEIVYLSDTVLAAPDKSGRLRSALADLAERVSGIHLHIDLDVHDPRLARANQFRPPGGLAPERLQAVIKEVVEVVPILSVAITAYDPDVDPDGVTLQSCLTLLEIVAGRLTS